MPLKKKDFPIDRVARRITHNDRCAHCNTSNGRFYQEIAKSPNDKFAKSSIFPITDRFWRRTPVTQLNSFSYRSILPITNRYLRSRLVTQLRRFSRYSTLPIANKFPSRIQRRPLRKRNTSIDITIRSAQLYAGQRKARQESPITTGQKGGIQLEHIKKKEEPTIPRQRRRWSQ